MARQGSGEARLAAQTRGSGQDNGNHIMGKGKSERPAQKLIEAENGSREKGIYRDIAPEEGVTRLITSGSGRKPHLGNNIEPPAAQYQDEDPEGRS